MTEEQLHEIADRLEDVLISLKHRGVRDPHSINELEDIIDKLNETE